MADTVAMVKIARFNFERFGKKKERASRGVGIKKYVDHS